MLVLQVEDDTNTAKSVELMLKSEGHDCETASLGEEALRLVQEKAYDLILLDIVLPDMDGYEVINRLREAQVDTPILIQTGLISNSDHRASLGVPDCLVKPFNRQELSRGINSVTAQDEPEKAIRSIDAHSDQSERRSAPRSKTLKSGQIVYNHQHCVIDCLVLGLSSGGAALMSADMLNFPNRFQLRLQDGSSYDCETCWCNGEKLGVRFLGTRPSDCAD